jgi:AcrR family transcriptional regulator
MVEVVFCGRTICISIAPAGHARLKFQEFRPEVSKSEPSPHRNPEQERADGMSFVQRARGANGPGRQSPSIGTRAMKTRQHLLATARQTFMRQGYDATSIENIAEAAGVSRASVYTYFSSKSEILREMGSSGVATSFSVLAALGDLPRQWKTSDIAAWVERYFDYLEDHGGYMLVWLQAARSDDELRELGMRGSMRAARLATDAMRKLGAPSDGDPHVQGLALMALLDRFWYHWRITKAPLKEGDVIRGLARMVAAMLRPDDEPPEGISPT